ncbi:MAG TPA: hypothetical protein PKM67_05525 [Kiritimatiellia bacterium]|nr:hypothetical protein [Kiritimatiellia bacterium]HNS80899.1 hypothetical protein [Kiritimatiellia bacterium]HQQ03512.1 hypothetical protein [Kiritimatiellia bacterium]
MNRLVNILLLLAAVGLILLAGARHEELRRLKMEYEFTLVDPVENASPLVAFTTVALGGFRGLAADALWLRATRLQDEGRYFELVQLSNWITQLEPGFGPVWAFHAWNLAYNISVKYSEAEDRWRWVQSGIQLLRDKGLVYNPASAELYRELAWIFHHKVSGVTDQAHWFYKQQWADEMERALGGATPDFEALETRADALDRYRLEPAFMQQVENTYGPLDWRLPQAHAIYWAAKGRPFARGFYEVALDRIIFDSLAEAFRRGKLFRDDERGVFINSPNLDLLPRVQAAYAKALADYPEEDSIRRGHENFLREAIMIIYSHNRVRQARELFADLKERYGSHIEADTLEEFIPAATADFLDKRAPREALPLIEGALYQSALWSALGEADLAAGHRQLAKLYWDHFMESAVSEEWIERMALPPLEELAAKAEKQAADYLQQMP